MECGRRPNRSDVHLPVEEEAKLEEKTREYFDEKAPKRHTKPQRSEYASKYVDALAVGDDDVSEIPEYVEFQRLENDPQKIVFNGNEVKEEFVETEYYEDLNCIDKQHHTTGTGFIKVENANGGSFSLEPYLDTSCHASCKGNPATNDWTPAASDEVYIASDKPNRSDN
ncbi:Maternal effect embryo arrest 59 [Theobroma cacao]|uniref:Maternal effect embryo arrest 59 n=1 Tax=Theobroma cacao TaxID=3641 RepID=A0A061GXA8_THECC|nr:Maternal effect embryo arrest 59 [Theobroma cacao]